MHVLATLLSLVIILIPLIDAFETILQPRRVTHRFRYARLFYRSTWTIWRRIALRVKSGKRREAFLGTFGPLSLIGLFVTWCVSLILGFALLHWSVATPVRAPEAHALFLRYFYLSG